MKNLGTGIEIAVTQEYRTEETATNSKILLETGDAMLLETGDKILKEV